MHLVIQHNEESIELVECLERLATAGILENEYDRYVSEDYASTLTKTEKFEVLLDAAISEKLIELFYEHVWDNPVLIYSDLLEHHEEDVRLFGKFLTTIKETQTADIHVLFPIGSKGIISMVLYTGEI